MGSVADQQQQFQERIARLERERRAAASEQVVDLRGKRGGSIDFGLGLDKMLVIAFVVLCLLAGGIGFFAAGSASPTPTAETASN